MTVCLFCGGPVGDDPVCDDNGEAACRPCGETELRTQAMERTETNCRLCGDPMPEGEAMFKYHGYSGPCPKPPMPKPEEILTMSESELAAALAKNGETTESAATKARTIFERVAALRQS